jgi:hypothetical protein
MNAAPPRGRYYFTISLNSGNPSTGQAGSTRQLLDGYFYGYNQPYSRVNYPLAGTEYVNWTWFGGTNAPNTDYFMLYASFGKEPLPGFSLYHQDPYTGLGEPFTLTPAAPGAGNMYTVTTPNYARWRIRAVSFEYTTNATAGARLPYVGTTTGGYWPLGGSYSTVSSGIFCSYYIGATALAPIANAGGVPVGVGALPNEILPAATEIEIGALGMTAGDALSSIVLDLEEFTGPVQ